MTARRDGGDDGEPDRLAAWVRRTVDAMPPPSERQHAKLAALLDTRDMLDTHGAATGNGDGDA